jgi:hypothetical protein
VDDPEATRRNEAIRLAALFVPLSRAGGRATFTEAEYKEVQSRYGGSSRATIHMEVLRAQGQPDEVQVTIVNKPPGNAELAS